MFSVGDFQKDLKSGNILKVWIYNRIFNYFPPNSQGKFVVARLKGLGCLTGHEHLVFRALLGERFVGAVDHFSVVKLLEEEVGHYYHITILGGGMIGYSSEEEKIIDIWGESQEYGKEPDREETIRIIKQEFSWCQIRTGAW